MSTYKPSSASPFLPMGAPTDRCNLHTQATMMWMSAVNGGHSPKPGQPDKAVDSIMESLNGLTLDGLRARVPVTVRSQIPNFHQLTGDALKSLAIEVAKMSVDADRPEDSLADATPKQPHPNVYGGRTEPEPEWRCWTNGTSFCSCTTPFRAVGGLFDDGMDVVCGLDCPRGCSEDEVAAAAKQEGMRVVRLCIVCGEETCVCMPGKVHHEYDPFCMRGDCTCMNPLPQKEDTIVTTFDGRMVKDEDADMSGVGE